LVALLDPGHQTRQACLRPTVATVERVLGLTPAQRRHPVRRLDGGFGPEAHFNWALGHGSQVLGQGSSGNRAKAVARAVPRWEERRPGERWMAPAPTPLRYYRRTQTAVLKWKTEKGTYGQSLLTTSLLESSLGELAEADDDRAAIAAEIKADTGGLPVHRRRTQRLAAQEALVVLTDLAHNLLAWTRDWRFHDSPFADAGIYRLGKALFPIPGNVLVEEGQVVQLRLKTSHPLAKPMLAGLTRCYDRF
jgi:hypothetical protein